MRDLVFLPVNLIKLAEQESWSRSLSYFIKMKALYQNNTHYNYSLRTLSDKIKCSPACLSYHIKLLQKKNLIVFNHGNVTFLGLKKLSFIYGDRSIGVPVDFKNQLDLLRSQLVRFNLASQRYNIKKSEIKMLQGNTVPFSKKEKTKSCYTGLSAVGFGKIINLSKSSGSRIRKKLCDLGVLIVDRVFSVLFDGIDKSTYINLRNTFQIPNYSLFKNGRILVQRRCAIQYFYTEA